MQISKLLVYSGSAFLVGVQPVLAGPGGFVSLINATPFDWVLVNQHEYQMEWQPKQIIPAGTSHLQYFEYWYHHGNSGDCAAEATYALMGSPTPQHLTVQARQNGGKRIEVQYHDTLKSLNNPENALIKLGYVHDGVVQFVLASNDGISYVSSNPPVAWMQGTLPTISSKTMRTLSMPASHDSGISELTYRWTGIPHNTQTQSVHIYKQLINGARFFDIRPVLYKGKWYTGHFSPFVGKDWVGATGRTIDHIIGDINRFTSEHPGELIILDITHDASIDRWWSHLSDDEWQNLYVKLSAIKDLWIPRGVNILPYDISTAPISTFINPGSRSAVIIRIPSSAPEPGTNLHKRVPPSPSISHPDDGLPVEPNVYATFDHDEIPILDRENGFGDSNITLTQPVVILNTMFAADPNTVLFGPWKQAFFSSNRLPQSGSYAETRWPTKMSSNQLDKLSQQASESDAPHMSYWILTQYWTDITDFGAPRHSIINMARKAYRALFTNLWPAMRRENKWPNLIIMDDIHNTEVAALCMGINSYFPHPDTRNQYKNKRGIISSGQNNSNKTREQIQCEAETRARNEYERRDLFIALQKSFKHFQTFQHRQTQDQERHLIFESSSKHAALRDEMEKLHQQQTAQTISLNYRLNNDNKTLPEKNRIRDQLSSSQSRERLGLSILHIKLLRGLQEKADKMRKDLIEEQFLDSKEYLGRQEKAMKALKYEQNDFLDNVLKDFFGDDKMPFCPRSRHEWPIPKEIPTPAWSHKESPVYNSTSIAYIAPKMVYSSIQKNPYVVHPTGAYYSTSKSPYGIHPTGAYYTTTKNPQAIPTKVLYSVSSKNSHGVYELDYSVLKTTSTLPGKYSTFRAPYRVAPTGGYYSVSKDKYHPIPTGAYLLPSKKVHPTGVYHSISNTPVVPSSVVSITRAYSQSIPTPVNAYSLNSTQVYQLAPTSTFVRPYYHLPSGLKVHSAPYGRPKPVYGKPIWSNGTFTSNKEAYGTNIPLPPYNPGPRPIQSSISSPWTNFTTSDAPQTTKTTTVNGGTTTYTEFSTFTVVGTIPASRLPIASLSTIYVPTTSEESMEPITSTVIGGTTTFTVFSTHTVIGILPATPVYKPEKSVEVEPPKKMTTLGTPAIQTTSPPAPTSPAPTSPAPTSLAPTSPAPSSPAPSSPAPSSPAPSSPAPAPDQSTPVPTSPRPTPSYVTANAARSQTCGILGLLEFSWTLIFFWGMV